MTEATVSSGPVDVVIPTLGRRADTLGHAVASVLDQEGADVNSVIVVLDDPEADLGAPPELESPLVRVIPNERAGDTSARQVGVEHASAPWIAFLDDDDVWEPDKLRKQGALAHATEAQNRLIVSSRSSHVMDGSPGPGLPGRLIADDEPVAHYLFHKRSPRVDRPSLFTSSLLVSRDLCEQVPWRRIPRHQDWDWLLRAERAGARVIQHPDVLVRIRVGSPGSISRSPDWASSLEWAQETLAPHEDSRLTADFLASQTLRYALTGRSGRGARASVGAIRATGTVPHAGSIMVGAAGLLPVSALRRLLTRR